MPAETPFALQCRVPVLYHDQSRKPEEISDVLGISLSTVYATLSCFETYGTPHNPLVNKPGRKLTMTSEHIGFVKKLILDNPVVYQDEIQAQLVSKFGLQVSLPTISRALSRLDYSRVRITKHAAERNEMLRLGFRDLAGTLIRYAEMLMFLDESAKDVKTYNRQYGYTPKGTRCEWYYPFVRGTRHSLAAALSIVKVEAAMVYEGSVNSERFYEFLRDHVIPRTTPYPGPRSVIVLDNCAIHHTPEVRHLVEVEAECKLLFLPPYSPDFSPIENAFSAIKAWLRRHGNGEFGPHAPIASLHAACLAITSKSAEGWFKKCGWA